jgi:small redox-active disulfide protein 2
VKIEICGPGCPKCHSVLGSVKKIVKELELEGEVDVQEVTDIREIISKGVMITPGLVIDGVKVSEGKVPGEEEIEQWVKERI